MILRRRKSMIEHKVPENIYHFEWEAHPDEHVTVVALNNTLDYFKGQPFMRDGQLMARFNERMVKDCRYLDGCIYFIAGKVPEYEMNALIEVFQKMKKEHVANKTWEPTGKVTLMDKSIIV